jgi:hypothetical protein
MLITMLELLSIGRVVGGGGGPLGSLAPHIGIEDPSPNEGWHWLGSSGRQASSTVNRNCTWAFKNFTYHRADGTGTSIRDIR